MWTEEQRIAIGANVKALRQRTGKSQTALAGLLGKSPDWLKKIESGIRGLPLEMGIQLGRLVGIKNLSEIYGQFVNFEIPPTERPSHSGLEPVSQALTEYVATEPSSEPPSVDWMRAAIDRAWKGWHESPTQRSYSASELPALIRAARAAVRNNEGVSRRRARAALADVMHLSQAYLAWQENAHHWYWLSVDRGYQAGEDADEPQSYATGLLYSAFALRVSGREEEAMDNLRTATRALDPMLSDGPDDVRGLWGVVQLARASTKAREQRDPSAWVHWEAAESMLSRLPEHYSHHHGFSRGHVEIHKTWLAQSLGDSHEALRHAEDVDLDRVPSRTWQASHLVHVARALHQQRDSGALIALAQAEEFSSEAVQFNLGAREIITTLATKGHASVRTAAEKMAGRLLIAV